MPASERLRQAIRERVLPAQPARDALAVARSVAESGGESVLGALFFGSRKTRAGHDAWSAYDLFVLTREYRGFYRSLKARGSLRRAPTLVTALNKVLPPNQISLMSRSAEGTAIAKCAVISLATLERETSERRRDHFCTGRLFQPTELLYARDAAAEDRILAALANAHTLTLSWVRPWLPEAFDVEAYCRTLLRVSLSREIRPEPEGRAEALWSVQRDYLTAVYGLLLEDYARAGELEPVDSGRYRLARPVTLGERVRLETYFSRSLMRATERWFKYVVTFDDWLDYILRKAQRHTGREIILTPRERRLPLVFLWPRLVRYLREKNR